MAQNTNAYVISSVPATRPPASTNNTARVRLLAIYGAPYRRKRTGAISNSRFFDQANLVNYRTWYSARNRALRQALPPRGRPGRTLLSIPCYEVGTTTR